MVRFIDEKLPQPPLMVAVEEGGETAVLVVKMVALQHRSVVWHLERMVRWSEDLVTRGGRRNGDPTMGSARMEARKFGKSYSQLLEVMVEHAQMEERVVFPLLETAERGKVSCSTSSCVRISWSASRSYLKITYLFGVFEKNIVFFSR